MKLWKGATFAFVLCGAALTIVLIRNMTAVGHLRPKTKQSHAFSSRQSSPSAPKRPPSSAAEAPAGGVSSESSQHVGGLRRRVRSADQMSSLLSECKINSPSCGSGFRGSAQYLTASVALVNYEVHRHLQTGFTTPRRSGFARSAVRGGR